MTDAGPDLELRLDPIITAPHDARTAVRQLLAEAAEDEFWQNALLATSEIVTHSLIHAADEVRLAAWYSASPGWLRVEITGGSGEMPQQAVSSDHPEVGELGLSVLLQVPSAWGIEQTPFGRVVWFEVQAKEAEA